MKFSEVLIYGFLDNFGFNGGKNGFIEVESIAKQDTPFAVMFITCTYLLFKLHKDTEKISNQTTNTLIFMFCLFSVQVVCHPIWTLFGERIAILVSGSVYERYLMMFFAALTVIFVGLAIASS